MMSPCAARSLKYCGRVTSDLGCEEDMDDSTNAATWASSFVEAMVIQDKLDSCPLENSPGPHQLEVVKVRDSSVASRCGSQRGGIPNKPPQPDGQSGYQQC